MNPPTTLAALAAVARYAQAQLTLPTLRVFSTPLLFAASDAPRDEALIRMRAYDTPTDSQAGKPLPTPTRV